MKIEEARSKAKKVFHMWYPMFRPNDKDNRDFELFFSGYLAGTKHSNSSRENKRDLHSLIIGDANKNLDL